jgi:hypothetical protein
MRPKNKIFFFQFLAMGILFLAALLIVPSCGKKGPPIPPVKDGNVLAAPTNLVLSLADNQFTLTWTHAIDPKTARLAPEAFEVFMAAKQDAACEGCPFVFKSMGVISMPDKVYTGSLEPGFHYYFRVQAMGKDEIKSGYSKTSYVDFTK